MRHVAGPGVLFASALLLTACQGAPLGTLPPPMQLPSSNQPDTTNASGDALMQRAAGTTGMRATALYLSAAEAYMAQNDWAGVQAAVDSAEDANLRADLFLRYANLNAALDLQQGNADEAEEWLRSREPALADLGGRDPALAETAVLQAAVCDTQQRWACAANALMLLDNPEPFISAPWFGTRSAALDARLVEPQQQLRQRSLSPERAQLLQLNEQIWHYVSQTPASVAANQTSARRQQQGWWALRSAAAEGLSLSAQQQAIARWQRGFADHSAQFPWPGALAAVLESRATLRNVAVLIPLSGPLSGAGNAVRNGFIAAQLTDSARLQARFYDTAAQPLPGLLERAVAEGAEVIIGPLSKTNVEALQELNPAVPVLALNYLGDDQRAAENVLQLGLAIEDEADTLARELLEQQLTRVLIVHSEADWSLRAAARLRAQFGETATVEPFANAKTVTEAVGRGMFVEESRQRSQRLFRQIGTHIEFVPRARKDLDAVIALVSNTEAQVLVPALKFHFGDHLPVFATGQATRGARAEDLAGLSGFQVTELPWFVNGSALATEVTAAFRLSGDNLAALYALGTDAYRIADRLPLLANHRDLSFAGSSGALSVAPNGRFKRELAWGVIAQRQLMPIPRVSGR